MDAEAKAEGEDRKVKDEWNHVPRGRNKEKEMMERYLIESPHTAGECLATVDHVLAAGYLTHFDWGCGAGEHCGWAIIEAESQEEALMVVPSLVRSKARAVRLKRFDPADVKAMHGKG